jgi:hypothetical protein
MTPPAPVGGARFPGTRCRAPRCRPLGPASMKLHPVLSDTGRRVGSAVNLLNAGWTATTAISLRGGGWTIPQQALQRLKGQGL